MWWHVANELLGLELLEFLIPTVNIQKTLTEYQNFLLIGKYNMSANIPKPMMVPTHYVIDEQC